MENTNELPQDELLKVEEELGEAQATLMNGSKVPVKIKTIYTYWKSGRKDCHIDVLGGINADSSAKI
jgi:hypothetical protein